MRTLLFSFLLFTIVLWGDDFKQDNDILIKVPSDNKEIIKYLEDNKIDYLKIPSNQKNINSQELSVIDKNTNQFLLEYFDDQISLFGWLITIIVGFATIVFPTISYLNLRNNKNIIKAENDNIKKDIEKEYDNIKNGIDKEYDNLKVNLYKEVEKISKDIPDKIEVILKEKYEQKIYDLTLAYSAEVMLLTPELRDLTLSRLRRTGKEFYQVINGLKKEKELAKPIYNIYTNMVQDWHILGQVSSRDRKQILAGLLAFCNNPFPELLPVLERLKIRYQKDGDLFPLINDAITKFEDKEIKNGN